MIDARELRIGNWVMGAGTGELNPVKITAGEIFNLAKYPEFAARIPLVVDILEKSGFEKGIHKMAGDMWSVFIQESAKRRLSLVRLTPLRFLGLINGDGENAVLNEVTYVHQLQNLYFCLTGKELEIHL